MWELNVDRYREREQHWRDEAWRFPPGYDRDASLAMADGYARLVAIIEGHNATSVARSSITEPRA
jgi:hypothetical protein